MSKPSLSPSLKQASKTRDLNDLMDSSMTEWISANKKNILIGILVLFLTLILAYRFISSSNLNAESDFLQAQADFVHFQNQKSSSNEAQSLESLEKILNRYPELQSKYDALIAQNLIIDRDPSKANLFANRTFQRLKNEQIDLYEDYARTSLLISEAKFEQALLQAKQLKEHLASASSEDFGATLSIFNLIRIAFLYQQLNQNNEEIQAWNDLDQFQGNQETMLAIQQLFKEGNLSLGDYVAKIRATTNP